MRDAIVLVLTICTALQNAMAFMPGHIPALLGRSARTTTAIMAKTASKGKKKTGGKTKPTGGFAGASAGGSNKGATPKELMTRSEKQFQSIELSFAQEMERGRVAAGESADDDEDIALDLRLKYFIMCARLKGEEVRDAAVGTTLPLTDWVPVCQLCILDGKDNDMDEAFIAQCAATYAKEVHYALTTQIPSLAKVAAPLLEYAAEPMPSFEKYVYPLFDPSFKEKESGGTMGKKEATAILFPGDDAEAQGAADAGTIKRAHRKMSMKFHPDAGAGLDASEVEANAVLFRLVQEAYSVLGAETHSQGMSWYEAVGGTERSDFTGSLPLGDLKIGAVAEGAQKGHAAGGGCWSQAVQALDPDIPNFFATRNAAAVKR